MRERGKGMGDEGWGERGKGMDERGRAKGDAKMGIDRKNQDKKNFLSLFLLFPLHLNKYFTGKQHMRLLIAIIEERK